MRVDYKLLKRFKDLKDLNDHRKNDHNMAIIKTNKRNCQICCSKEHEMKVRYLECRNYACSSQANCAVKQKVEICLKTSKTILYELGEHASSTIIKAKYGKLYFVIF